MAFDSRGEPAFPAQQAAPSLTPSRRRRLSLKALTAPFRRSSDRPTSPPPTVPANYDSPLDHPPPTDLKRTPTRSLRTPSILSRKLRRKSLVALVRPDKAKEEAAAAAAAEAKEREEKEARRTSVNWQKRTADQPMPSEAANIRAAWLREQQNAERLPPLAVHLDPRGSISSIGSILFPAATPGQHLGVFSTAPPRAVQQSGLSTNYSTYAPSTISTGSQRDDLLRTMAKPFPSRPPSHLSEPRRQSLSMASPPLVTPGTESETDELPSFVFPVPPPRQSDLPTPPASPQPLHTVVPPPAQEELLIKEERYEPTPLDTPPHTPQRFSFSRSSDRQPSPASRRSSAIVAEDFATAPQPNKRRPLSLTLSPTAVPIFTRSGGGSPFSRLGHGRSASVAGQSSAAPAGVAPRPLSTLSASSANANNPRRPVSIAPQLGGRRMSASLASSGAFPGSGSGIVAPGGANRQSWASTHSQSSSIGSNTSAAERARGLLDEVRRRAEERERRSKGHKRGESTSTATQDKGEPGKWQPAEAELLETENFLYASPLQRGSADLDETERRMLETEAEEMFSDERMQALVRELGI
ncbi:hypothetical protein JCM10207_006514 [Rhodosporidiobolus poonsookiae]